ncbi:hypothetical protein [Fodinicurvata sp. EGI_FJ10296]|uniref:hypothetical protein n=1 Tax=Fodinicurvata sp. EGI_FJ10296 TaxID=3231908 RepID=UPI0034511D6E
MPLNTLIFKATRIPPTGTVVSISGTDQVGRVAGRAVSCGNVVAVIDVFGEDRTVIAGAGQVTPLPSGPRLVAVDGRTVSAGNPAPTGREVRAC